MGDFLSSIQAVVTSQLFQQIVWAIIIIAITAVVAKLAARAISGVLRRGDSPLPSSSIIINIIRGIIWIIGVSSVLDNCFGINTSSLLAALGVGGIAVSLGFQDTLSNLIGGLQVTLMGIVKPGDNIEVGSESGVVQDVTWRHTTIRDSLGQTVIIPNSIISTTALVHLLPASRVSVPFTVPRARPVPVAPETELTAVNGEAPGVAADMASAENAANVQAAKGKPGDAGTFAAANRPDAENRPESLDELSDEIVDIARRAASSVSGVTDGPHVYFSEVGELGIKGNVVLTMDDASKTSAAKDAVVRAIATLLEMPH